MFSQNPIQALALARKNENYPSSLNIDGVYGLIGRVLGPVYADAFVVKELESDGFDRFCLSDITVDGLPKILLEASSGTAAAAAVRWYLQNRCNSYIGPLTSRLVLPTVPPNIGMRYETASPFLYRFFMNYCTFSYSLAFWTWQEWEPFLDWLLLSGYNLVLNIVGNERVWETTLINLGYTRQEARNFLCSPAFFSWQALQNISGWGGAAPEAFYDGRAELSRQITQRLNQLGAHVVLPGYCGMVPDDFRRHYPQAQLLEQGLWCGFRRPDLLHPDDPMFCRVAEVYYDSQKQILGDCTPYFNVLPFHEGGNCQHIDLTSYAQTCYRQMQRIRPSAVWVMDGWGNNPMREILQALPPENVLIINLKSEVNTNGGDNFADRPWVLGTINNFGGLRVLRANLCWQYHAPHKCIADPRYTMVGIGMLPEGIEIDECCFDLFSDLAFAQEIPSMEQWQADYLRHRYGICTPALTQAWDTLCKHVYVTDTSVTPLGSALCALPSLEVSMHTYWAGNDKHTYHPKHLITAARSLLQEQEHLLPCTQYRWDVTEVLRQLVGLTGWGVVKQLQSSFRAGDMTLFEDAVQKLMKLFDFQSMVLADSPAPTLQQRLDAAARHGKTPEESQYFTHQLKTQITTWGDRDSYLYLANYSYREWSGMVENFYRVRWEKYIQYLRLAQEDADYPRYEIDHTFCVSDAPLPEPPAPKNLHYASELLTYCQTLLDSQTIAVAASKQEHAMEAH